MTTTRLTKTRAFRKRRLGRFGKWIKRGLLVILVLALAAGAKVGWSKLKSSSNFKIVRIDVVGAQRATNDEILYLAKIKPGMGIFDFKLSSVVKSVESHPWVRKAQVSRELPDQVIIRVWEQAPVAIMVSGELYYLNSDLEVFKKLVAGDNTGYPIITGLSLESMTQRDEATLAQVRSALAVWGMAGNSKLFPSGQISELHVDPAVGLSVVSSQGPTVVFGDTSFENKFRKLERIRVEIGDQFFLLKTLDLSQPERVVARFFKKGSESEPAAQTGDTAGTQTQAQ